MECDALDITTAFLNADLDETIYMQPPPGWEKYTPDGRKLYCLLLKAIYRILAFPETGTRPCNSEASGHIQAVIHADSPLEI
ncbi:hypothetical protein FS842_006938, partial [Serendipita sp. 407]